MISVTDPPPYPVYVFFFFLGSFEGGKKRKWSSKDIGKRDIKKDTWYALIRKGKDMT